MSFIGPWNVHIRQNSNSQKRRHNNFSFVYGEKSKRFWSYLRWPHLLKRTCSPVSRKSLDKLQEILLTIFCCDSTNYQEPQRQSVYWTTRFAVVKMSYYKIALSHVSLLRQPRHWSIAVNSGRSRHSGHTTAEWGGRGGVTEACAANSRTDVQIDHWHRVHRCPQWLSGGARYGLSGSSHHAAQLRHKPQAVTGSVILMKWIVSHVRQFTRSHWFWIIVDNYTVVHTVILIIRHLSRTNTLPLKLIILISL